jgi:cytochrome bd-type quinol oxidase subunit 2
MKAHGQQINRVTARVMMVLSVIALLMVLSGYMQSPQPDEGAAAHIFQLSIAALVPAVLVFFATADWTQPWRSVRPLLLPGAAVMLAFAALYYLEHYYYVP